MRRYSRFSFLCFCNANFGSSLGRTKKEKPKFTVVNGGEGGESGGQGKAEETVVGMYARDRWVGGAGRLPTQGEWEELFGNGAGGR